MLCRLWTTTGSYSRHLGGLLSYLRSHSFALIFQPLTLNPKDFVLLLYCRSSLHGDSPALVSIKQSEGNLSMAVVTVYARHSKKCLKSKEKKCGQYKRCNCPLWLRWGKDDKKSAKTRTWDIATKAARKLEQELELEALGIEPIKKPDHITIESAADLYLGDMAQRGIKDPSKARRMLARLRDYANARQVMLLKDVTARLLTEWRSNWTFKMKSGSPAVHWSVVKTFFKWAFSTDLIPADPSAKLKSLPCEQQPSSASDSGRDGSASRCYCQVQFDPEVAYKVRTFILLQRWSGFGVHGRRHAQARWAQ